MGQGNCGGGSEAVAEIIDEYGEALERDLLYYYNVDIYDVVLGKVHPRRVLNLVRRLPEDSVTKGLASGGEDFIGWDASRTYLALLLENQIFMRHEYAQSMTEKKLKPPQPLKLPGREEKKQAVNPFQQMFRAEKEFQARQSPQQ